MFTINGIVWQLRFVRTGSEYLRREDGTYTIGMTNALTHTVYLSNKLHGKMLEKVLAHELVHCIFFSYNIIVDSALEEKIAQWVSTYGRQVVYLLDDLMNALYSEKNENKI